MKQIAIYLSAPLLLVSALASAAPQGQADQHPDFFGPHKHGMMPPRPMPLYAATETTTTPAETLKNLVAQVPQTAAGKYQVKVEVLPLPEKPAHPAPADH